MLCIARDYRCSPLKRIANGANKNLVYVIHPDLADDGSAVDRGVGFPREHVFEFDEQLFRELAAAFDAGDMDKLEKLWRRARPLKALPN
jgi:hypothetical protein